MIIESVRLKDFRNYENLHVELDPGINVFYGDNGEGKTNILEALYVSATTKSHRGSKDKEMIRFSCEEAHIKTDIIKNDIKKSIDIHIKKKSTKGIAVNHIPIKRAADLFGIVNAVIFAPEDLDIIKNGPSERRRFMDMELCQLNKVYLSDLTNYNKVLVNRAKLLKSLYSDHSLLDTLDVWDEQLVRYGKSIIKERRRFIEMLSVIIEDKYFNISGKKEKISIKYEPNVSIDGFDYELKKNRDRDIRFEQNNVGPHRDDIYFAVDNADIRKFGSQGQKRSAALALKLSEVELVKNVIHDSPILMLDDVLSELDKVRQSHLLSEIKGIQTIMTSPDVSELKNDNMKIDRFFYISNGEITEEANG